jgi:hypothetical protein
MKKITKKRKHSKLSLLLFYFITFVIKFKNNLSMLFFERNFHLFGTHDLRLKKPTK